MPVGMWGARKRDRRPLEILREINLILPPWPSFFSADNPGPFVSCQQLGIGTQQNVKREKKRKKAVRWEMREITQHTARSHPRWPGKWMAT